MDMYQIYSENSNLTLQQSHDTIVHSTRGLKQITLSCVYVKILTFDPKRSIPFYIIMGRPLPRPGGPPGGAPCCSALGFLMVSSTDRIRHAASEAAVMALIFMTAGSRTQDL